jgi:predicted neutral ceramidase superfamily lipid hydrolase
LEDISAARQSPTGDTQFWKAGATIAATTGFVFGTVMLLNGIARFGQLNLLLLAFSFFMAFGSAIVCGAAACALVSRVLPRSYGTKA